MTCLKFFFFNDTATTEIYTLSLHDALPISALPVAWQRQYSSYVNPEHGAACGLLGHGWHLLQRSEEHTSELQSQSNLVCRLLLETKKTQTNCRRRMSALLSAYGTRVSAPRA